LPVQLEVRWVSPALAPDYLEQDFTKVTPNQYLMRAAPLQKVEYRVEALLPPPLWRVVSRFHSPNRAYCCTGVLGRKAPSHRSPTYGIQVRATNSPDIFEPA
jgi:hypothetical protein